MKYNNYGKCKHLRERNVNNFRLHVYKLYRYKTIVNSITVSSNTYRTVRTICAYHHMVQHHESNIGTLLLVQSICHGLMLNLQKFQTGNKKYGVKGKKIIGKSIQNETRSEMAKPTQKTRKVGKNGFSKIK